MDMTQLIDVAEKVMEYREMDISGYEYETEEDLEGWIKNIITQANTLHTQKVSDLRKAVEGKRDYWKKQVDVHVDKNREMLAYDMCSRVIAANSILSLLDTLEGKE